MSNTPSHPLQRAIVPPKLPHPINPALIKHAEERAGHLQDRIADAITRFAGSMQFVYIHIIWFAVWIIFRVENYPFGLLTMIVSLEAIFLSTFVMISQNRADAKRQIIADQQWKTVQEEDQQNRQLLDLSHQILELTRAVHGYARLLRRAPAPAAVRPKSASQTDASFCGVDDGRPNSAVAAKIEGSGRISPPRRAVRCWDQCAADR